MKKFICPFCSCGCGLIYDENQNRILPDKNHPISRGFACIKGLSSLKFQLNPKRINLPLIRTKNGFKKISYSEAFKILKKKIEDSNISAMLCSSKASNEDLFVMQKFARIVMKTPYIDNCVRLCHASSLPALIDTFGTAMMQNSLDEIKEYSELVLIFGNNPADSQPLLFKKLLENKNKEIYVFDILPSKSAKIFKFIKVNPGSDFFVVVGLIKAISEHINIPEKLNKYLSIFSFEDIERISGVRTDIIKEIGQKILEKRTSILYGMGITQNIHGIETIKMMANLLILTKNFGKKGCGINPIRGQNNVQGACDLGCIPNYYPGYSKDKEKFENFWDSEIPDLVDKFESQYKNLDLLYIVGENSLFTLPHNHAKELLESSDFVVVQDPIFTSTAEKYADLYIPVCTALEKEGTYTSTGRLIQYSEKVFDSNLLTDWQVFVKLAEFLGLRDKFNYKSWIDIFKEICELIPQYNFSIDEVKKHTARVKINLNPKIDFEFINICPRHPNEYLLITCRYLEYYNSNEMLGERPKFIETSIKCEYVIIDDIKYKARYNPELPKFVLKTSNSTLWINKFTSSKTNKVGEPLYKYTYLSKDKVKFE